MSESGCDLETDREASPPAEPPTQTPMAKPLRAANASPTERTHITPRRTVINYWVDLGLLLLFVALAFTTGVTQFVFPNGPVAYEFNLWGGDYRRWQDIQFGCFAAFGLGIVLHLTLHWNWMCSVTNTHVRNRPPGRDDGARTLLGVGLLVAVLHVLGIGLLLAWWSIGRG